MGGIGQFKLLAILNNGQSENASGTIGGNCQNYFFYIKMYAHDILYGNVGIHKGDCQNILTAGVIPDSNWVMKATCCADIWTYFGP